MRAADIWPLVGALAAAFVTTVIAVAAALRVCRERGWVVRPQPDRWHTGTPAKFGGVPIWLVVVVLSALVIPAGNRPAWVMLAGASLMFTLGLIDDLVRLQPGSKLLAQGGIGALSVACGLKLSVPGHPILAFGLSLGWIVGLTNALNLLDNMDGLAAGVALVAASYGAVLYLSGGLLEYASLLLIVAGATGGFLVFNFHPAKIFMGDSGSLFLGFLLATASLPQFRDGSGVSALVLTPVIVLSIPILDTFFVSVTRRLRGQPVSVGGTDHSSHRLVRMGLNERSAVLLLYLATGASGAVAIGVRRMPYPEALGFMLLWLFFLVLFGIHLFHTEPAYDASHHAHPFLQGLLRHDSLAFLLDPAVLSLAYYFAYLLRFETAVPRNDFVVFLHSWPIVLLAKCGVMWACGIYRHSWWRGSGGDAYRLAAVSAVGEALTVLIVIGLYGFSGYSRIVFLADFVISWMLLIFLRRSFHAFRESIRYWGSGSSPSRRVFVLGTSENTEVVLRFLASRQIKCAGLIDTNGGSDVRRHVWGMEVIGQVQDLPRLAAAHRISEVILPENEAMPCSEAELVESCSHERLRVIKLGLHLLPLPADSDDSRPGPVPSGL